MAKKSVVSPAINAFHAALNAQESKVGRFLTTAETMRIFTRMQPQLRKAILKGIEKPQPKPKKAKAKPKAKGTPPKLSVVK